MPISWRNEQLISSYAALSSSLVTAITQTPSRNTFFLENMFISKPSLTLQILPRDEFKEFKYSKKNVSGNYLKINIKLLIPYNKNTTIIW
jgi:hypothetical protein